MDDVLDVALNVARVLEDHEVVIAQVEEQPAQLFLVDQQTYLTFHSNTMECFCDSSLSRFQLRLRAGGAKRGAAVCANGYQISRRSMDDAVLACLARAFSGDMVEFIGM